MYVPSLVPRLLPQLSHLVSFKAVLEHVHREELANEAIMLSYWLLYKPISFYDVLTGCECTVTCLPLPPQLTMLQCRSHPTSRVRTLHVVVVLLLCNSIPCLADEHTHTVSGPTLREWRVAFSSMHIAIAIVHANFQLCDNTFVASAPCRLFVIQLFVQSLAVPTGRVVFSWYKSATVWGAKFLPTCDFFDLSERQVGLASQTFSVSTAMSSAYRTWALEAIGAVVQKGSGLWD